MRAGDGAKLTIQTVAHEGQYLRAYVDGECVFATNDPAMAQRIFLAIGLGEVSLGRARFTGRHLIAVARETASFWTNTGA